MVVIHKSHKDQCQFSLRGTVHVVWTSEPGVLDTFYQCNKNNPEPLQYFLFYSNQLLLFYYTIYIIDIFIGHTSTILQKYLGFFMSNFEKLVHLLSFHLLTFYSPSWENVSQFPTKY